MARQEDAPFVGASIGRSDVYELANQSVLNVATQDGEWQRGLAAAEREVRTALRFGFTKAEMAEQLANFTTGYENAVRGDQTRPNDQLADQILAHGQGRHDRHHARKPARALHRAARIAARQRLCSRHSGRISARSTSR